MEGEAGELGEGWVWAPLRRLCCAWRQRVCAAGGCVQQEHFRWGEGGRRGGGLASGPVPRLHGRKVKEPPPASAKGRRSPVWGGVGAPRRTRHLGQVESLSIPAERGGG